MIIEIDDSLTGKERLHELKKQYTRHALKHTRSRKAAAKYMGISKRALQNWLNDMPEVKAEFPIVDNFLSRVVTKLPPTFAEAQSTPYYRYADSKMKQIVKEYYERGKIRRSISRS